MESSFQYGTKVINFTYEYRKRKTLSIEIKPPQKVHVKAPEGITEDKINEIVMKKGKWIKQKLFETREIEHQKPDREFVNGESFMYLGRNYSLQIIMDETVKKTTVSLYQGKLYVTTATGNVAEIKAAMEYWYREKTLQLVMERIKYYQPYIIVMPRLVKVKQQKKRWGSCTSKKNLYFNWRCCMAPAKVLDYIVVHEMCHMVYLNHSKEFWNMVGRILPDYKECREWLKKFGIRMDL